MTPAQLRAFNAMRDALRRISALQTREPDYDDWGGDTEEAETWGIEAGRFEAAKIARSVLSLANKVRPALGKVRT